MVESLALKNNSRWLKNLQIEPSTLIIDGKSTVIVEYPASLRVLNYDFKAINSDISEKENLTIEAEGAVSNFYKINFF